MAAILALVLLPTVAFAVVTYETRSRAALQQRGGWAPPAPPERFVSKLQTKTVTVSEARSSVNFALVVPAGLPTGASLVQLDMGPVGLYDGRSRQWHAGPNELTFSYRVANGARFDVVVRRYDNDELPGRYVFEDLGPDARGNPQLVKHENFAWRNGDQMTTVSAASAIDERDILRMAHYMNGTLLTLPWPSSHAHGVLRILTP